MAKAVRGKVARIYPHKGGTYVGIKDVTPQPKDKLFVLKLEHPNYRAVMAVVLSAFVNRYDLQVTAEADIKRTTHGVIDYVTIDA